MHTGFVLAAAMASAAELPAGISRFDLVCTIKGEFVRSLKPGFPGSWHMPVEDWEDTTTLVIDLRTRRWFDPGWCKVVSPCKFSTFDRIDARLIVIDSHPDRRWTIRRGDGRFERSFRVSPYLVEVSAGYCRRKPFSGFGSAVR